MNSDDNEYITFGADIGDEDAANAVSPHLIVLRKLLKLHCNKKYAPELNEFAPIARIDGEFGHWEFEGTQKLRLSKKHRYITVDIGMPKSRWQGVSPIEIRRYLIENFKQALHLFVGKLRKEKYEVDDVRLFEDFEKMEKEYLEI
ncbi:MAG: hypothetical protein ACYC0V_09815 [Armatimonadota bacterium]